MSEKSKDLANKRFVPGVPVVPAELLETRQAS